jgi:hypothetical protein
MHGNIQPPDIKEEMPICRGDLKKEEDEDEGDQYARGKVTKHKFLHPSKKPIERKSTEWWFSITKHPHHHDGADVF